MGSDTGVACGLVFGGGGLIAVYLNEHTLKCN